MLNIETILNRRRLLLGLAASASAAATVGPERAEASELPDLIAMGDQIPEAVERYKAASDIVTRIAEQWSPQWPLPPEEIITFGADSRDYVDIRGRGIKVQRHYRERPLGKPGYVRVGVPEGFADRAKHHDSEALRRSKFKTERGMKAEIRQAEQCRAAIEPARDFWAKIERIKAASGIEAAEEAQTAAREELHLLVDAIMAVEERTVVGLAIKAQALEAWNTLPRVYLQFNERAPSWTASITASILRHSAA